MRRTYGGRGKGGAGRTKGDDDENATYVPKKFYLAKDKLSSYPDEDGCPFYLGDAEDEKTFFAPGFLLSTRSSRNEEYFHRPGMALSLGAASMHRACRTLRDRLSPCWADEPGDPAAKIFDFETKFKKTGLSGLLDLLYTSDGNKFLEALETLDVGREGRRDQNRVETAVRDLVDVLEEHGNDLRKNASRAASFAAKIYLGSMSLIEHLELFEHRKEWSKNMEDAAKSNKHIKAWTKNPKDGDLLVSALTASFMEKVKKHAKGKAQRKQAADTSSEEDDDNEDSAKSGDSEHDSPRHREEKRRRAKKRPVEGSSSEDSGVASRARKQKEGDRKTKEGKRLRQSSSLTKSKHQDRPRERNLERSKTPTREEPSKPPLELKHWNIEELNLFLQEASHLVSQKEFGKLHAKSSIELLARVPADIRKTYGLDYKDAKVIERNAARAVQAINACVTDVLAAYKASFGHSPPEASSMALEFSDVEDDNPAEALALVSYTNEQATKLTSAIEHARANMDSKAECLKINQLLALLEQVPFYFLDKYKLAEVAKELASRQRMPRKDNLKNLYDRIFDMGTAILALHAAQTPDLGEQPKTPSGEVALRELYQTWPRVKVKAALADVNTAKTALASTPQHIYPMEHLSALVEQVPLPIIATHVSLENNWAAATTSGDTVSKEVAETLMKDLIDLITIVDAHYEQRDIASAAPSAAEPKRKQAS